MKNEYRIDGDTTVIFVKHKGQLIEVLIDTEDLDKVKALPITWYARYDKYIRNFYIFGEYKYRYKFNRVLLHRIIMDTPEGLVVDHLNHNTIDNRKCNLANVTQEANVRNFSPR